MLAQLIACWHDTGSRKRRKAAKKRVRGRLRCHPLRLCTLATLRDSVNRSDCLLAETIFYAKPIANRSPKSAVDEILRKDEK
jgi:hypothetical protein